MTITSNDSTAVRPMNKEQAEASNFMKSTRNAVNTPLIDIIAWINLRKNELSVRTKGGLRRVKEAVQYYLAMFASTVTIIFKDYEVADGIMDFLTRYLKGGLIDDIHDQRVSWLIWSTRRWFCMASFSSWLLVPSRLWTPDFLYRQAGINSFKSRLAKLAFKFITVTIFFPVWQFTVSLNLSSWICSAIPKSKVSNNYS